MRRCGLSSTLVLVRRHLLPLLPSRVTCWVSGVPAPPPPALFNRRRVSRVLFVRVEAIDFVFVFAFVFVCVCVYVALTALSLHEGATEKGHDAQRRRDDSC